MCLASTLGAACDHAAAEHEVSRRNVLLAGAALAAAPPLRRAQAGPRRPGRGVRDLTHTFRAGFPVYAFDNPARRTLVTVERDGFYAQQWTFAEHSGTHMDVPGHFVAGGRLTPAIRPQELVAPLVVVDIRRRAAADPDAEVTPEDLERHEHRHGRIPRGAAVFMLSGWEERAGSEAAYRNADAGGTYHFPGFGLAAVEWLLERRHITCIGVDTLSLDHGPSTSFAVHHRLLGADRYGLENLANLADLPPRGATAVVGVVPLEEGSGGPCRVLALLP